MKQSTLFRIKLLALAILAVQLFDGCLPFSRSVAHAAESNVQILEAYEQALNVQAQKLSQMPSAAMSPSCQDRYARVWSDGVLKIDFFYGYLGSKDPVVADRLMRYTMVQQLLKPCSSHLEACGFELIEDLTDSQGPYKLRKMTARGEIELAIWDSAYQNWRSQNTHGVGDVFVSNKRQSAKTKKVWDAYLRSFREADVVIYDGHSELGTGPGFAPLGLLQFSTARFLKQNLSRLKKGVSGQTEKQPSVIVLAACESKKYYLKDYRKLFPASALLLTDHNQQFQSGEQMVFSFIDSLAVGRCTDQMEEALKPTGYPDAGTHVYGFESARDLKSPHGKSCPAEVRQHPLNSF